MQYLSRAYQYYSGINPATLTGAIDVIVVRRKDDNGEEFYSCSPFHVRFGKLQVLRAGEKKVQLQLPDNLPEPYQAPFWMKVGEAGEAFFVVETDQEVPEELQTSPVISATEISPVSSPTLDNETSGSADEVGNDLSATQKPFGKGRGDASPKEAPDRLQRHEPEFLDLNDLDLDKTPSQQQASLGQTPKMASGALPGLNLAPLALNTKVASDHPSSSASPSTILNAASSLLPSFLHSSTPSSNPVATKTDEGTPQSIPSNPLEGKSASQTELFRAQKIQDYVKDHKSNRSRAGSLASLSSNRSRPGTSAGSETGYNDRADAHLPHVAPGEGEGPDVQYTKDAVLDAMGYHADTFQTENDAGEQEQHDAFQDSGLDSALVSAQVLSENMSLGDSITLESENHLIQFAQDLLVSAGAPVSDLQAGKTLGHQAYGSSSPITSQNVVVREIARRLNSLSIDNPASPRDNDTAKVMESISQHHDRLIPRRDNFMRGQSEPPPDIHNESGVLESPRSDSPSPYPEDGPPAYTWEWGGFPMKTPGIAEQEFEFDNTKASDEYDSSLLHVKKLGKEELVRSNSTPTAAKAKVETSMPGRPKLSDQHAQTEPVLLDDAHASQGGLHGQHGHGGKLKNDEDDPYKFMLDTPNDCHIFELSTCAPDDNTDAEITEADFDSHRITFRSFVEDPSIVDNPSLVIKYGTSFLTWQNASPVLAALAVYRRSLLPPLTTATAPQKLGSDLQASSLSKASKGYAWSRWWRRGQSAGIPLDNSSSTPEPIPPLQQTSPKQNGLAPESATGQKIDSDMSSADEAAKKFYAKTLRLTSEQLKSLRLKIGANKVVFSVNSSYSGTASCTARIFLWDEDDRVVISDIDGTITKSDALGHVFAAIGRDWTHLGVAKLYTDICNNGYKIMYLTSRAIGQADSTRDYLKSISQGSYQLPEGPVIMSPDRLFTSLHREVIMRKPEIFKMACLRDIQRLFGNGAKAAFYAGFGNRITDAMSYRSVNVPSSRIFTIDSGGEVKMELLELAGYKSSYIHMTDLVDQMFPPVNRKLQPEYTDFNYWRPALPDIPLPDFTPVSPALSATSESSRLGLLRNMASGIARRASRQTISNDGSKSPVSQTSRPTSPLVGPSVIAGDVDFDSMSESEDVLHDRTSLRGGSMPGSLPGSMDDRADYLNEEFFDQRYRNDNQENQYQRKDGEGNPTSDDGYDYEEHGGHSEDDVYPEMFDDDLLATGEMSKVPF